MYDAFTSLTSRGKPSSYTQTSIMYDAFTSFTSRGKQLLLHTNLYHVWCLHFLPIPGLSPPPTQTSIMVDSYTSHDWVSPSPTHKPLSWLMPAHHMTGLAPLLHTNLYHGWCLYFTWLGKLVSPPPTHTSIMVDSCTLTFGGSPPPTHTPLSWLTPVPSHTGVSPPRTYKLLSWPSSYNPTSIMVDASTSHPRVSLPPTHMPPSWLIPIPSHLWVSPIISLSTRYHYHKHSLLSICRCRISQRSMDQFPVVFLIHFFQDIYYIYQTVLFITWHTLWIMLYNFNDYKNLFIM